MTEVKWDALDLSGDQGDRRVPAPGVRQRAAWSLDRPCGKFATGSEALHIRCFASDSKSGGLERVPELVGMRHRALGVRAPRRGSGSAFDLVDEIDRRAPGVDHRIYRGASRIMSKPARFLEYWNTPTLEQVAGASRAAWTLRLPPDAVHGGRRRTSYSAIRVGQGDLVPIE